MPGPTDWRRPRFNNAGGPIDEMPRRSALPSIGTAAAGADATGQPAPSLGWMLTRAVPEEAPPPGSSFFNVADSVNLGAAGVVPFAGSVFNIDADRYGVLKSLDLEVTDYTSISNVQFTLFVNDAPVNGFQNIRIPPANASLKTRGFDLSLPLGKGAKVSLSVNDVDGGVYIANVSYFGWQWAVAIDARYRPEGVGVR